MDTIVALDVGTTGAKAAAVSRDGKVQASGYAHYPTFTPQSGWIEQDPQDWWNAVCRALQAMVHSLPDSLSIRAVALSGQMQDTILIGSEGVLGHAILYSDSRAQQEATKLHDIIGAGTLTQLTGNSQGAASVLAKWLWLSTHLPQLLNKCETLLFGAHDYLCWRLCGVRSTDYTTATTTGLLNLSANTWISEVLQELALDPSMLPELRASGEFCGQLTENAARQTGLPANLSVYQGVGDLGAATVGVGAGNPGRLYCYLGTSGWIAATQDSVTPHPEGGVFTLRHPNPQRYIQVAPMVTAGGNLEWIRSALTIPGEDEGPSRAIDYATLNQQAENAPVGSHGLLYLPYLSGERSPFSDPNARACFVGLSTLTTQADLVRAVMEGTAMAYRALRDALEIEHAGPLLLAGGGAKSTVWPQILADVLGCQVQVTADPGDAPARGAAIIVGKSLGWYPSYVPTSEFFPMLDTYYPAPERTIAYNYLFQLFHSLYPKLKSTFLDLSAFGNAPSSL